MFLTTEKLLERFQGNLKHTDQIDIAVAWATSGTALQLLERWEKNHPKRIRAMVGTFGNATEPDALERLANIGELRLADGDRMFHPKVYIFRGKSLIAWVGSANLTEGGFKNNEAQKNSTPNKILWVSRINSRLTSPPSMAVRRRWWAIRPCRLQGIFRCRKAILAP